jgi:hypothetical protein
MLRTLPQEAWDRYRIIKVSPNEEGQKVTVQEWISGMARHLQEHLEEIADIRNAQVR